MKKTIAFVLLCALLSVGVIGGGATALDSKKEAVVLDEEILCGDPAAAEGLSLTIRYDLPNRATGRTANAWWDLHHTFKDGVHFDAAFHFLHDPPETEYYWEHQGLRIDTLGAYEGANNGLTQRTDAFYETLRETLPLDPNMTWTVDLADYFDTLPLWFDFDYPRGLTDFTVNEHAVGSGYVLYQTLNDLFPIPVPENTAVTIDYALDHNENLLFARAAAFGYDADENPLNSLTVSKSVCTPNGLYFTLSPTTATGIRLDLSRLELGYGIYYLPVIPYDPADPENDLCIPDADGIKRVIELDPAALDEILQFEWNEADDRLYLLTRSNDRYTLHCYQASTHRQIDRIDLGADFGHLRCADGYLLATYEDNTFSVFAEQEQHYVECFRHPCHLEEAHLLDRPETTLSFDGRRLAVASADYSKSGYDYILAVYDGSGLQFHANYSTSLYGACFSEWYHLQDAPMILSWGTGAAPQSRTPYSISPSTVIRI